MTARGRNGKQLTALDPDAEHVVKLLNSWIRSELAFRGRQVYRLHTAEDGTGIDRVRYLILRQLFHGGPRRLSDLADAVTLTPSHASRVVDSLVKQGLVDRTVPDGDRRVTLLSVSDDGRALMEVIDAQARRLIAERLACAGFTQAEAARFGEYLERFADETERWAASVRGESGGVAG
jgi:DNA-binding MarR family transcriptional regulator